MARPNATVRYEANQQFPAILDNSTMAGLLEAALEMRELARRNVAAANPRIGAHVAPAIEAVRTGELEMTIRIRRVGRAFIGNFAEAGAANRRQKTFNRFTGTMPQTPFMQPARDEVLKRGVNIRL